VDVELPDDLDDLITLINARHFSLSIFSIPGTDSRIVSISKSYYPPSFTDHDVFSGMGRTALEATKKAVERIIAQEKW
jgi:hypothetical protein